MKLLALLAVLATAVTAAPAPQPDYFFRYLGGNDVTTNQRLRTNTSNLDFLSPGVTPQPHNPADHFARISVNSAKCSSRAVLNVVPTNPHPPPVPGYYGLTDRQQSAVPDAYRLVYTYRLEEQGEGFKYTEWVLSKKAGGDVLLRYNGLSDAEWKWVAVKEQAIGSGVDKWVPWLVKKSADLGDWDFADVDLALAPATGPVNSNAPGGVEE